MMLQLESDTMSQQPIETGDGTVADDAYTDIKHAFSRLRHQQALQGNTQEIQGNQQVLNEIQTLRRQEMTTLLWKFGAPI
jgi:hypothetical protein